MPSGGAPRAAYIGGIGSFCKGRAVDPQRPGAEPPGAGGVGRCHVRLAGEGLDEGGEAVGGVHALMLARRRPRRALPRRGRRHG